MPFASLFGSFSGGPFHGLAFDGLTFDLGIVTDAGIAIGGVDIHARVRKAGLTIHDILNDAPNTCSLVVEGTAPAVGQSLRITINDGRVLFAGAVQSVDQSYSVNPDHPAWAVTAIDDTARANQRRPFGTWVDTSATTIAQAMTATFAPGFSSAGIEAGLPLVSIVLDGADTFIAALTRLASLIGGYAKVEDGTIYLFLDDTTAPPDPIDSSHCFMFDPPIQATIDSSQLRTRVYGKGYGESITADLLAGETLVPIENGVQFPPAGQAIAGTKADAAQSERLAYTGRELAAGGTLVGPGASPTVAPELAIAPGAGVTNGAHDVAVVFVTALGKSLPGPKASITVPTFPPPATAATAAPAIAGTGPALGTHDYVVSFVTAFGETLPGPPSNTSVANSAAGYLAAPGAITAIETAGAGGSMETDQYHGYRATFLNAVGETELGAPQVIYVGGGAHSVYLGNIPLGPAGTTGRRIYRCLGGDTVSNYRLVTTLANNTTTGYTDTAATASLGATSTNTNTTATAVQRIPLSNIPLGPSGTTGRKLYRRINLAGAFYLVTTLADNTTTTYTDAVPNGSLGPAALTTPTAVGNQILATIPKGATAVTGRELYMSPVGSSVRKLALVVPDNTATTATITMSDASLAVAAGEPIADTSGLQQPQGQVNAGSTVLPVAAASPFRAAGGWVALAGDQVVRYTGITGATLSGIPASGPGAITTTVIYGAPAIPAPMLTGVTGITGPILKGAAIHIWVERNDLAAQAEQAARAGGDGVIEHLIVDTRRGLESLVARCDADLALFARPLVTVAYATRDLKTKSGKPVVIDLASPAIHETLIIQDVTITEIDQVPGVPPRYTVTASSVRFSLEDTLRRLIAGGQIVGGSS
jgi:hypothetical protein